MCTENFRFYIKAATALNIQAKIIFDELYSVYGDQAPSFRTTKRWSKLFREGREELKDEPRSGRPATETTPENIEQIRLLVNDDPYLTIEELQEQTNLSNGTIHRILTTHLNVRKVTARYVPKDPTDAQRAERVRICEENLQKVQQETWRLCDIMTGDESRGDPPPTVARQSRYVPRILLAIFFKSNGPLLIYRLERGQTIDHEYYIDNCLRPVVDEIKRQRPSYGTRGMKIHHDNEEPHVH
ncbi:unnamed protein product [Adineta ricciae]|uniref:Transposase n=1 Tax=Adineta ricciae TaxID=249248 RepID=A0A816FQG4_ADIRI|nr:unnamed protein product [Adineta ricciae]